jgi:hypothetical protein
MGDNSTSSTSTPLTGAQRQDIYNSAMQNLGTDYGSAKAYGYQSPQYREFNPDAQATTGTAADVNMQQAQMYDPGAAQTLTGGDYNRLEQQLAQSRLAGLGTQRQLDTEAMNQSLADRGIWSSGIAARAENDLSGKYADIQDRALAEAANQRYALQAQELGNLNQYALGRSGQQIGQAQFNTGQMNQGAMANQNAQNQFGMANMGAQNQMTLANQQGQMANNQAYNAYQADQADKRYQAKWRPADYLQGTWNGTGGVVSSSSGGGWSI